MSKVTELATAQLTVSDIITVELIEADENWPWSSSAGRGSPPCNIRTVSFAADPAACIFAAAPVRLATIKRERRL